MTNDNALTKSSDNTVAKAIGVGAIVVGAIAIYRFLIKPNLTKEEIDEEKKAFEKLRNTVVNNEHVPFKKEIEELIVMLDEKIYPKNNNEFRFERSLSILSSTIYENYLGFSIRNLIDHPKKIRLKKLDKKGTLESYELVTDEKIKARTFNKDKIKGYYYYELFIINALDPEDEFYKYVKELSPLRKIRNDIHNLEKYDSEATKDYIPIILNFIVLVIDKLNKQQSS